MEAMIFAHISRSLRETFPARASEWAMGVMLFNWAIVLSFNADLFQSETGLIIYQGFNDLAPQPAWAVLCLVVGGGRLIVLAINGAWRRTPHLRTVCAFISCLVWFEISIGLMQNGLFATGLAVYPVLFVFEIFNVMRSIGEAGISDANLKRVAGDGTQL